MKKRIAALMLVFAMTVLMLAGCGGSKDAPVVGTWNATTIEMGGSTIKIDEWLSLAGLSDMKNEMELKSDGKLTVDLMGEQGEGTWKYEEPKVTLTIEGDDTVAEYKDGKIVLDLDGAVMTFEK